MDASSWKIVGISLICKGLACYILDYVRNLCKFCVFLLKSKAILSNPRRSIMGYTLHQGIYLYFHWKGSMIATRSKRVYTLVSWPSQGLYSLGSKRVYTPRRLSNQASLTWISKLGDLEVLCFFGLCKCLILKETFYSPCCLGCCPRKRLN